MDATTACAGFFYRKTQGKVRAGAWGADTFPGGLRYRAEGWGSVCAVGLVCRNSGYDRK